MTGSSSSRPRWSGVVDAGVPLTASYAQKLEEKGEIYAAFEAYRDELNYHIATNAHAQVLVLAPKLQRRRSETGAAAHSPRRKWRRDYDTARKSLDEARTLKDLAVGGLEFPLLRPDRSLDSGFVSSPQRRGERGGRAARGGAASAGVSAAQTGGRLAGGHPALPGVAAKEHRGHARLGKQPRPALCARLRHHGAVLHLGDTREGLQPLCGADRPPLEQGRHQRHGAGLDAQPL
jgi:hypothetical protein